MDHKAFIQELNNAQLDELRQPLEPGPHIEVRADGQRRLRHEYIRAELARIHGPYGWSEEDLERPECFINTRFIEDKYEKRIVAYHARQRLIIRNPDSSIRAFWDGAGSWGTIVPTTTPDWFQHSDVKNGARTVALCRAAMNLGTKFGLALYSVNPDEFRMGESLPYQIAQTYGTGDIDPEQLGLIPEPSHSQEEARDPA